MEHSLKSFVTNSLFEIIIIAFSIFLGFLFTLIGYPLLLILLLYRSSVIFLSKWKNNTWISINILSSSHAVDTYNHEGKCVYGFSADVDKSFDYKGWIERIHEFIDKNKRPELKCFLHRWFGTYFLVPCDNFSYHDVVCVDHSQVPTDQVSQFLLDFILKQRFPKNGPLWQIRIFPDLKPNACTIVFDGHHAILDAVSAMSFFVEISDFDHVADNNFKQAVQSNTAKLNPKRPFYSTLLIALEFVFVSPCHFMYKILHLIENNMWSSAVCNGPLLQIRHVIDMTRIKKTAKSLGTSFTTLLTAALTGAMREEMKARGQSISQNCSFMYILPTLQKHPYEKKLTNAAIGTILSLPTGIEDRLKRVEIIAKRFEILRRPALKLFCHVFGTLAALCGSLYGSLPGQKPRYLGCGGWSNLVAIIAERKLMGKRMSNITPLVVLPIEGLPIALSTVTWNNDLILNLHMDAGIILNDTELRKFAAKIEYEISCYSKLSMGEG